ncbi:adhesin [Chitinophaga oryziterrae]|uniref:Adhesin n=1 Tax=Chitinophaga oryziterrae TaxID=1031224 RepID=A0A6N8JJG3_9BACT|nr:adhesin [Chitinophaga oryziterrae]MVT44516.1 adhesin [Chitinophaga oryziterrae]
MGTKNNQKIFGREELKEHFKNGRLPTEQHFAHLIDSTINKQEDGFSKDEENGMLVAALGNSKRLVSFYKTNDDLKPFFLIEKDEREKAALRFQSSASPDENDDKSFFFHTDGSMGIGKTCDPDHALDVNGFVGMEGRVGTYLSGTVEANGHWHSIVKGLNNCSAFEVMARTGLKGSGKFAITHAIALTAFGKSRGKIRHTSAYYGFCWNRIRLRWVGSTRNYDLQIRTGSNYGTGVEIYYKITKLWDDDAFMPLSYRY